MDSQLQLPHCSAVFHTWFVYVHSLINHALINALVSVLGKTPTAASSVTPATSKPLVSKLIKGGECLMQSVTLFVALISQMMMTTMLRVRRSGIPCSLLRTRISFTDIGKMTLSGITLYV
jgi:hypothetical protein